MDGEHPPQSGVILTWIWGQHSPAAWPGLFPLLSALMPPFGQPPPDFPLQPPGCCMPPQGWLHLLVGQMELGGVSGDGV